MMYLSSTLSLGFFLVGWLQQTHAHDDSASTTTAAAGSRSTSRQLWRESLTLDQPADVPNEDEGWDGRSSWQLEVPYNITVPALIRCSMESQDYQQGASLSIRVAGNYKYEGSCNNYDFSKVCERILYVFPVTATIDVDGVTDTKLQCGVDTAVEMQYNVSETTVVEPVQSQLFVWKTVPAVEEGFNFSCSCSPECSSITMNDLVLNEEGVLVGEAPKFKRTPYRCYNVSSRGLPTLECSGTIPGLEAVDGLLMQVYGPRDKSQEITVRCDAFVDASTLESIEEEEAESTSNTTSTANDTSTLSRETILVIVLPFLFLVLIVWLDHRCRRQAVHKPLGQEEAEETTTTTTEEETKQPKKIEELQSMKGLKDKC